MGKESRRCFQVLLRPFSSWQKRLKEAVLVSAEMACCVHRVGITNTQPGVEGVSELQWGGMRREKNQFRFDPSLSQLTFPKD